jgi:hypothetical protein
LKVNGQADKKDKNKQARESHWRDRQTMKVNSKNRQERQAHESKERQAARQAGNEDK